MTREYIYREIRRVIIIYVYIYICTSAYSKRHTREYIYIVHTVCDKRTYKFNKYCVVTIYTLHIYIYVRSELLETPNRRSKTIDYGVEKENIIHCDKYAVQNITSLLTQLYFIIDHIDFK